MAAQIFPYGTALTVVWHLSKPDGTDFDITGYTYRVYYRTGNKETEASGSHLTASGNTISIVIPATEPSAPGEYALRLVLYQNNRLFCTLNYNAAFVLSRRLAQDLAVETQQEEVQVVHLYTVAEFYLFTPIIPTVGSDGYWYVNGTKVTDGQGEFVPSSHTMEYDAQTNYIIIDRERVDSQGHSIAQTITSLADALSTAAEDHETAQEDHSTAAGDHETATADHTTATWDHQAIVDMIDLYEPITINGDVTNAPDEEDITSDENDLLKFKDRGVVYGMGYCILRRNKTFAEQLTKTNTIYEIRYDFDLTAPIVIPFGCVLKFVGGSVAGNYTITGQDTKIEAGLVQIFGADVTIAGTWNVSEAYPEWFGAKGNGITNDSAAIAKTLAFPCNTISLTKVYGISDNFYVANKIIKGSNATVKSIGKARFFVDASSLYNIKFDVNSQSVERAFLILQSGVCFIKNCEINNIAGEEFKDGAYAITVYIETTEAHIENCSFVNITDRRRDGAGIGTYTDGGFTGAIYFRPNATNNWTLTSIPKPQYIEGCYIDECRTLKEDGSFDSLGTANDADAIRVYVQINDWTNPYINKQAYYINNIVINNTQKRSIKLSGAFNAFVENVRCTELLSAYSDNFMTLGIADSKNVTIKNYRIYPTADRSVYASSILVNAANVTDLTIEDCEFTCSNFKIIPFSISSCVNVKIVNSRITGDVYRLIDVSDCDVEFSAVFNGGCKSNYNLINSSSNNKIKIIGNYTVSQGQAIVRDNASQIVELNGKFSGNIIPFYLMNTGKSVNISATLTNSGFGSIITGASLSKIPFVNLDLNCEFDDFNGSSDWLSLYYINYCKCTISASIDYTNVSSATNKGLVANYMDLLDMYINKFEVSNLGVAAKPMNISSNISNLYIGSQITFDSNLSLVEINSTVSNITANLPDRNEPLALVIDKSALKHYNNIDWMYLDANSRLRGVVKGIAVYRNSQDRPTGLKTNDIGYSIFDVTLGRPVFWNGTAWVDATGTTVE